VQRKSPASGERVEVRATDYAAIMRETAVAGYYPGTDLDLRSYT